MRKTFQEKNINQNKKAWYLFDANNQIVGRLATQIARILVGKHKATYTRHVDTGDFVVVVNADKVSLTGQKWSDKLYYDHTGFVSGLKTKTAKEMLDKHPEEILRRAVWGMMHKSKQAKDQLTKLKIYTGTDHPHAAQKPTEWKAPARKSKAKN
ncbi:MAG TPA: 50S ribosomal protein L13 [Oligoflexia bacterium]|nr:50S ribosomal protein L13 [Oligoflexia bacterium]